MPNHLSILGIIHTAISIIAIILAFYALAQKGKINPSQDAGRLYAIFTVIACITSLPIMETGHPTPGHLLAIIILVLLPLAIYVRSMRLFRRKADYIQTVLMSTTLFLSLIPAVNETLTRLPPEDPLATGPDSFIVRIILLVLFILYITGIAYQVLKIKARKRIFKKSGNIIDVG
jgi:phosphatidylglycerophosphate synthase